MSVTVLVTFNEFSGPSRTVEYQEDQHKTLLALEDLYRKRLIDLLPPERQGEVGEDSRHFWFNGKFQPHRERHLYDICLLPTIALDFRPDAYVVSTPRKANMEMKIDPEQTIEELLAGLQAAKMIGATCCYEILNSKGQPLKSEIALWMQVLPYLDPQHKRESHLHVRLRSTLMFRVYLLLALLGLLGVVLGWLTHRSFAI